MIESEWVNILLSRLLQQLSLLSNALVSSSSSSIFIFLAFPVLRPCLLLLLLLLPVHNDAQQHISIVPTTTTSNPSSRWSTSLCSPRRFFWVLSGVEDTTKTFERRIRKYPNKGRDGKRNVSLKRSLARRRWRCLRHFWLWWSIGRAEKKRENSDVATTIDRRGKGKVGQTGAELHVESVLTEIDIFEASKILILLVLNVYRVFQALERESGENSRSDHQQRRGYL